MLRDGKPLKKLASCALCCLAAAAAVAGPPPAGGAGGLLGRASAALSGAPSRSVAGVASRLEFQRLDLRPPEALPGGHMSAPVADSSAVFPSAKRAQEFGTTAGARDDLPGSSNGVTLRMESKVQEMERRVPREGLPVARLWESKTALLHVGLNAKGKPGLWLIQKVP